MSSESSLVSIITPVLDAVGVIERCLDSVRAQDYPRIEHILVDGGSSDGTLGILERRRLTLGYLKSEPDSGTAEAYNKGVAASRGDVIAFLNADDWYEPDAVSTAVAALEGSQASFTYGPVGVHNRNGLLGVLRPLPPGQWQGECLFQMPVPHISMFIRRNALERIGPFAAEFTHVSDHDQFVRLLKAGFAGVELPKLIGHVQVGGRADSLKALRQSMAIARRHGAPTKDVVAHFGAGFALYPLRKTAKRILGDRLSAKILKLAGSRHSSL